MPSKIFELAYNGLPSIYFAGGEGQQITQNYHFGIIVPVADFTAFRQRLSQIKTDEIVALRRGLNSRYSAGFGASKQMDELAAWLVTVSAKTP